MSKEQQKVDGDAPKRRMTYSEVQKMIADTNDRCQKTLQTCDKQLKTINGSIQTISETKENLEEFCQGFTVAMKSLCNKIAYTFAPKPLRYKLGDQNEDIYGESKKVIVKECAELFKVKNTILFILGDKSISEEGVMNNECLQDQPNIFWEWYTKEMNRLYLNTPKYLQNMQQMIDYAKDKKKIFIANENVKECRLNMDQNDIFNICGNIKYIRCDQSTCSLKNNLVLIPTQFNSYQELICESCKSQMRPHYLCLGEPSDQSLYGSDEISKIADTKVDLIILIGTQLVSETARNIVSGAVRNWIPIIEISQKNIIEVGGLLLQGKIEELVPELSNAITSQQVQIQQGKMLLGEIQRPIQKSQTQIKSSQKMLKNSKSIKN